MSNFGIPPLLSLFIHSIQNFITDLKKKFKAAAVGDICKNLKQIAQEALFLLVFKCIDLAKWALKFI